MKYPLSAFSLVVALVFFCLSPTPLQSQVSLDRYIISFAGSTNNSGDLELDATAGDLAITTTRNGPLALFQGFQQGDPGGHSSDISTHVAFLLSEMRVYPNPTRRDLHLSLSLTEWVDLKLLLYNAEGRLIQRESFGKVHELDHPINLEPLAKGLYLLMLTDSNGQLLGKIKVLKW